MNPTPEVVKVFENKDKMIQWNESFETLESEIDGMLYKGFDLFKKVYEAFPDIAGMTKDEATEAGLYPIIHYRNHAARKWMAEMNGGHLATLDEDYNGELREIYKAARGRTNLEKLAAIGQAPLGLRNSGKAMIYNFGNWASLGSGSLDEIGDIVSLLAYRYENDTDYIGYSQATAISSVVVLDK